MLLSGFPHFSFLLFTHSLSLRRADDSPCMFLLRPLFYKIKRPLLGSFCSMSQRFPDPPVSPYITAVWPGLATVGALLLPTPTSWHSPPTSTSHQSQGPINRPSLSYLSQVYLHPCVFTTAVLVQMILLSSPDGGHTPRPPPWPCSSALPAPALPTELWS